MGLRVIITGVTGMVGEGVLHECLSHPDIESILILGRKAYGISHPKVTELVHSNFLDINPIKAELSGYQACFFCLGVTSIGLKEPEYKVLTYDLTLHVAGVLSAINPGMVFTYVSGKATDSTEKGGTMWARVKGKTENDLMKLPFRKVYCFRPGYMQPTAGLRNTLSFYRYIDWSYPVMKRIFPDSTSTLAELGQAMIYCALKQPDISILEVRDIRRLAHQN